MKRLVGVVVALGLVAGVAVIIEQNCCRPPGKDTSITLRGLIGSEKSDFFDNRDVQRALTAKGLTVHVDHAGSWQMATDTENGSYDFAFPASSVAAAAIKTKITTVPARPFYSPLVVLARSDAVDLMKQVGLASDSNGILTFKTSYYLDLATGTQTWQGLDTGDQKHPALRGQIFVSTTNPQTSSSAALYLATMAYLRNKNQVVSTTADADRVGAELHDLMARQGSQHASSDQLFKDFIAGVGNPLIWTYESEAAERARNGKLPSDVMVLYPDTGIQSDHTIVELTDSAKSFSQALQEDPTLTTLEAQFGFRPSGDPAAFGKAMGGTEKRFVADVTQLKVAQAVPPSTDNLRELINVAMTGRTN
ncbi:hypothetical protein [Kitasatospora azatica]|uniref:hypothetical protein n=1 Tax=Kitasatospora azatica TaxID=58347 RepID=UPI000568CC80|nr:hypothetical protein [Kitasatospora azatica]